MNLEDLIKSYCEITDQIIVKVKDDGDIEGLVQKREEIINNMKSMSYTKEEFKRFAHKYDIIIKEEKLHKIIDEEKVAIRYELDKIKRAKNANKNYSSNMLVPNFFNKKI